MEYREMNFEEDEDRTDWDKGWRERPLRLLVSPVQIDVVPTQDPAWGEVVRIEIASDPPQFSDAGWRQSEICPVCGNVTSADNRIAASIYPYFESGFSYGLSCWVHETCLLSCEEIAGPAPGHGEQRHLTSHSTGARIAWLSSRTWMYSEVRRARLIRALGVCVNL